MSVLEMVREFHEKFGLPVRRRPNLGKKTERELRLTLIDEEFDELVAELSLNASALEMPKVAKELADLIYVAYGLAVTFGIPIDEVIAEVHRSNMSKLGPDGKPLYREDGKVLKGPDYAEADVEWVLLNA